MIDHARHTPYSDPGRHAARIAAIPADLAELSAVARNVIVHYLASGSELPVETRGDINARWLEHLLTLDQARHPRPLAKRRRLVDRVQGCCRDHTLFSVGVLRSHGVAARSRVGFAGYFIDGWHHDHVIVEAWIDGRWRRFDPEIEHPRATIPTPLDIGHCDLHTPGFVTAAQVWAGYRTGEVEVETYGVGPDVPVFRGERFVFDQVIYEIAHRCGDELLLWDAWGRIGEPGTPVTEEDAVWMDGIARLLLAADRDDVDAERALLQRYRSDPGLHPGASVLQASPFGDRTIEVDLTNR